MASSDTAMLNGAVKHPENASQPEIADGFNVPKKSRRRQRKTAQAQSASTSPTDTRPSSPKDALLATDNKPKNWEASLTMAELKALRSEEAAKKHNRQFPPRAKPDPPVPKPKKARQLRSATPKQETQPGEKISAAAKPTGTSPPTDNLAIRYEQPLPPCGIRGCPVRAYHERRPYVFNEENRPAMIKMIQNKAGASTEADWSTLDRFFILHGHVGKVAKVEGQAKPV
ncbi:MAG: hypothetical protein Q9195_005908 [Heterodermia aff. obscurata]